VPGKYRRYPRSGRRAIIHFPTLASKSTEYVLLCVNRAIVDVARVFIRERGLWPSSYAASYDDSGYTSLSVGDLDVLDALISEFLEDTSDMNCNDFINGLTAIATAITSTGGSSNCGCGSVGAGSLEQGSSSQHVDVPGSPGGEIPPGFADQSEYEDYKCDVAHWIFERITATVSAWLAVDVTTITVTVFLGLLLVPVPGARVLALLAAVVAAAGLAAGVLASMSNALSNAQDNLICDLYNAETATEARSNFVSTFEAQVDSETSDLVWRFAIKAVFDLLVSFDAVNKLFVKDEFTQFPTGNSCGLCGQCPPITMNFGSSSDINYPYDCVSAQAGNGKYYVALHVAYDGCGPKETLEITALSGWTDVPADPDSDLRVSYNVYNGLAGNNDPNWDQKIATPTIGFQTGQPCRTLMIRSETSFTCTVDKV
jgi:hypothetical protein